MTLLKRWQQKPLLNALGTRRIVILAGARQCGKTTLTKQLDSETVIYRSLDDNALLKVAIDDPQGFVKHNKKTMIIDEIQRAPELLTAIKKAVDEDTRYGQYLITGSANIQTLPTVKESLAGRVRKIRLRPFTQGELLKKEPRFFERVLNQDFADNKSGYDKSEVLKVAFTGGYPEPLTMNDKERKLWYRDYASTLIENDLKDVANIRRQDSMKDLLAIMAAFSSKLIDKSEITRNFSIAKTTLSDYINALESLYLIERVNPYLKSDYERINKQSKTFMTDTGLMSTVLNWKLDEVILNSDKSGKLMETFVFNQLSAQIDLASEDFNLYHYRDREKREIDFIVECDDETIIAIEVKAGSSLSNDSAKHLKWFKNNIAKDKKFIGIILYTGENAIPFGENLFAVPMNNLWD